MAIFKKTEKPNQFILSFSKEEMANPEFKGIVRKLIEIKLNQKNKEFITISPAEFEIVSKLGEFVPRERYSKKTYEGEVGKIKGKRLIVNLHDKPQSRLRRIKD